jgi:transmembrane sensor
MKPADELDQALLDRAADWLARRDAGFSPGDAEAFQLWLAADPRHARAADEIATAWSALQRPRENGCADWAVADLEARARSRQQRRRRRLLWSGASLAAAAVTAVLLWSPARPLPAVAGSGPIATVTPRPDRRVLEDGSIVELKAGADITVTFSPTRRGVRLVSGEVHFAVAKDSARPFVVAAGGVETTAVGTEFSVALASRDVQVLVTEGRVAIATPMTASSPTTAPTAPIFVDAGTRVTAAVAVASGAAPRVDPVTAAEVSRALAWRNQRMEFSGTPLAEAVAHFNRQNRLQLALTDDSLGTLRVSGIFWTDDPAGFARLIEPAFSLQIRAVGAERIEISR